MGIREDLRLSILIPLSFGFIVAAILGTGFMGYWVQQWPTLYRNDVIFVEQNNLRDISISMSANFAQLSERVSLSFDELNSQCT